MSACWISFTRSGVGACWPRATGLALAPFFPRFRTLREGLPFFVAEPFADGLLRVPEPRRAVVPLFFVELLLGPVRFFAAGFFLGEGEEVDTVCRRLAVAA